MRLPGLGPVGARLRRLRMRLRGLPDLEALRAAGLDCGEHVYIGKNSIVDPDFAWLISIGEGTTLSANVVVLAHDASTRRATGYSRVARTRIGARVFIGASVIVLPGVTIGDEAVVGAGSVVRHDVPAGAVVAGVPARVVSDAAAYQDLHRRQMEGRPVFDRSWTVMGGVDAARKAEMRALLEDGPGYIR